MKKYTDDDVERLVETATKVRKDQSAWNKYWDQSITWTSLDALGECLAPFLPDPEEQLIEKMAQAEYQYWVTGANWEGASEGTKENYRKASRATLAVVKQEGLPS